MSENEGETRVQSSTGQVVKVARDTLESQQVFFVTGLETRSKPLWIGKKVLSLHG